MSLFVGRRNPRLKDLGLTRAWEASWPSAPLDLSPRWLGRGRSWRDAGGRIEAWHHAAAEASGLPSAKRRLITTAVVASWLPGEARRACASEGGRAVAARWRRGPWWIRIPDAEVIGRFARPWPTLLKSNRAQPVRINFRSILPRPFFGGRRLSAASAAWNNT